jgi:hypothetical protein
MTALFSRVRESCAEIALQARWVTIDRAALGATAALLARRRAPMTHTPEHHLLGRGDETLSYFLILDAINFGSGYFPHLGEEARPSGYFMVARALKRHCEADGIPDPRALARLTAADCAGIFRQDMANLHAQELMQLFALALNQLGEWVIERHAGDYLGFLRGSASAEQAVAALLEMPFFRDMATYGRREVVFLKRAQIAVHDMAVAEPGHPLLAFDDLGELTVFADNIVPFVLKADGILRYDGWLERRVRAGEPIGAGSFEEIEMRACAVHAAELLRGEMQRPGGTVTAREVDHILWNRGQELKTQVRDRPHVTRGIYY